MPIPSFLFSLVFDETVFLNILRYIYLIKANSKHKTYTIYSIHFQHYKVHIYFALMLLHIYAWDKQMNYVRTKKAKQRWGRKSGISSAKGTGSTQQE